MVSRNCTGGKFFLVLHGPLGEGKLGKVGNAGHFTLG